MGEIIKFEEGQLRRLIENDQLPEAIKLGNEWMLAESGNPLPYMLTGKARFLWNEFDEAERLLKMAIGIDPTLAEAYYLLGEKARLDQDYTAATHHMERAVRLQPDDYVYQFALAKAKAGTGNLQEAVATMEQIFSEHRDDPWMHDNLAEEYVELAYREWEPTEEGRFFPITARHIETAEQYCKKISQLKITSESVKSRVEDFKKAIAESKQRKYTGGIAGLLVSIWLVIAGFIQGGFWGYLYSASALLYYLAMRTPVYVINHRELRNKQGAPLVDRINDFFLGGDWFVMAGSVGGTIVAMAKLKLILGLIRAALQALFMPLTVVNAIFTNYSRKQAIKYVGGIAVFILVFSLSDGFEASLREGAVENMVAAAEAGNVRDLSEKVIDYPAMYHRNAATIYSHAVQSGQLNVVRYMEDKLRYVAPQAGRAELLKLARASESSEVYDYLQARYVTAEQAATPAPVAVTPSADKVESVQSVSEPAPVPAQVQAPTPALTPAPKPTPSAPAAPSPVPAPVAVPVPVAAPVAAPAPKVALASQVPARDTGAVSAAIKLSGCWKWSNGAYVIIDADGTAHNGPFGATWKAVDIASGRYRVTWPSFIDTLSMSADGSMLSGANNFGIPISATRKTGDAAGVAGTWLWSSGVTMTISPDSSISGGVFQGSWTRAGNNWVIEWPLVDTVSVAADGHSLSAKNQFGSTTAKRDASCKGG